MASNCNSTNGGCEGNACPLGADCCKSHSDSYILIKKSGCGKIELLSAGADKAPTWRQLVDPSLVAELNTALRETEGGGTRFSASQQTKHQ